MHQANGWRTSHQDNPVIALNPSYSSGQNEVVFVVVADGVDRRLGFPIWKSWRDMPLIPNRIPMALTRAHGIIFVLSLFGIFSIILCAVIEFVIRRRVQYNVVFLVRHHTIRVLSSRAAYFPSDMQQH